MAERLSREQIELQKERYRWMMSGESVPPPDIKFTLLQEVELCDLALQALSSRSAALEEAAPRAIEFWKKHALGSKICPSCFACGKQEHDSQKWAIKHLELPDIYICTTCASAIRALAQGEQNAAPSEEMLALARKAVNQPKPSEAEIIQGGVEFIMGPDSDEGTRPAALDREGWVRVPREHFSKFVDVHRSWCNYCFGSESTCMNAPSVGCSLRDVIIAAAPKEE